MKLKFVDFKLGLRNDHHKKTDWLASGVDNPVTTFSSDMYQSAFFSSRANTMDDNCFPTRGVNIGVDGECILYKYGNKDFKPLNVISFDARRVFPIYDGGVFILGCYSRSIFDMDWENYEDMFLRNYIGGAMQGRYLDQQIPFLGFNDMRLAGDFLFEADASLRFRLSKNLYTSLKAAYFKTDDVFKDMVLDMNIGGYGFAVEAAYKTIAGPLKANLHWSDVTHSLGAYISFGYDF